MVTLESLTAQLTEARAVYHDWRLGKVARAYRDANGEEVTYSVEGMRGLSSYIADLERQIAALTPGAVTPGRPMRVWM